MIEFYIVTDCADRGLYRKVKTVKQIYNRNIEARVTTFVSPQEITAAQEFCAGNGIKVSNRIWDDLATAGRLSEFGKTGTLPPLPEPVNTDMQQACPGKKDCLPHDAAAVIYTDGSYYPGITASGKNALGGWAAVIILRDYYDAQAMVSGHIECTSEEHDSYYMELLAINKALKRLNQYDIRGKTILYTDCLPVVTDYNEKLAGWADCGFQKECGKYIKYHKLWNKVWERTQNRILQVCWIKGHTKNPYNNLCHVTAQAEALMRKLRVKQTPFPEEKPDTPAEPAIQEDKTEHE